jgi:type VI secretion system secreted protein VgrG
VIVDFLEGDPDRPIITGRVYNAEQMPPYELPGNQTQSGIKSRSSKGGGAANFNEIRFEDKKGQEELYVHAERNLTVMVERDETKTVQHDQKLTVGGTITINCAASAMITCGTTTTITSGGPVTVTAPMIVLNAAMVQVSGVLQCTTLITTSVVSPMYTPGVGNLI